MELIDYYGIAVLTGISGAVVCLLLGYYSLFLSRSFLVRSICGFSGIAPICLGLWSSIVTSRHFVETRAMSLSFTSTSLAIAIAGLAFTY